MSATDVYSLIELIPSKLRDYAVITLDRANEELETYLRENNITLDKRSKDKLMLAIFLNFLEDVFVESNKTCRHSLSYLNMKDVGAIRFGRNLYHSDDPLVKEWNKLVDLFDLMRIELRQKGIPSEKTIPSLVIVIKGIKNG